MVRPLIMHCRLVCLFSYHVLVFLWLLLTLFNLKFTASTVFVCAITFIPRFSPCAVFSVDYDSLTFTYEYRPPDQGQIQYQLSQQHLLSTTGIPFDRPLRQNERAASESDIETGQIQR